MPLSPTAPLVSVIMPVFNGARYISRAIDSVLHQTYKNIELIIIDDGSTDHTAGIAKAYQAIDQRISVVINKQQSRQWLARNIGLGAANGDYIAWQDADDMADKTRIEKQLSFLKKNKNHHLVASDMMIINQRDKLIAHAHASEPTRLLHRQKIFCPSLMFRKTILSSLAKPYCRPLPIGEDNDLLYRLLEKKHRLGVIHQPLYHYRRAGGQTTSFHFLSLLYGELVRYSSYGRQLLGRDLLVFNNHRLLLAKDLPVAFIPFLREQKLNNIHDVFINRFVIGQYYSLLTTPMLFIKNLPLLWRHYIILLRYQFFRFLIISIIAVPRHLINWAYCRLTKKDFFIE